MKAMLRLLNTADISSCPDVFESLAREIEVVSVPPSRDVLMERIAEFDIYFASLHVIADRALMERACRLRLIASASTGLDHIDTAFAETRGITVLSLREDTAFLNSLTATAELAWALLLATVRRLPWAFAAAQHGNWARDQFRGHQISGRTLGILGYGRLGRIVAEYGRSFRMRVLAHDRRAVVPEAGVEMVDFERLLSEADVLSIHIHLTKGNRRAIGAAELSKMKPGAILVNTSRGGIVDEDALLEALSSGRLGGAGLDVIDGEWRSDLASHPLIEWSREHQNLVISPHIGGVTFESQRAAIEYSVAKILRWVHTQGHASS
ncbi:MAG TPA: NAD(P)-dependent oxidoreductase [Bryobacteraceae bacterium]|nr:NAD(P)-dependent oxidoreductase [Bryobacteraceae bacterium]